MRRTAPAVVSPEKPALITSIGIPSASAFFSINAGNACSGSRPIPAVRLVPKKRTTGFRKDLPGGVVLAAASTAALPILMLSFVSLEFRPADTRSSEPQAIAAAVPAARHTRNTTSFMLIAREVTKEYMSGEQKIAVLRDVSFTIPQGAFVAIVGPSGSGKTTLLGLLAGLDTPTRGTVLLDNSDLGKLTENERARLRGEKVGFVFQSFQLIPTLTALENVQVPLELRGSNGAAERARDLIDRVGLTGRGHHFPTQLSGGEQQRVAVARAFANAPRILFADEPTGNLDNATGHRIFELLQSINSDAGTTIALVTHELALASKATRIIRLLDGAVVGSGP